MGEELVPHSSLTSVLAEERDLLSMGWLWLPLVPQPKVIDGAAMFEMKSDISDLFLGSSQRLSAGMMAAQPRCQ